MTQDFKPVASNLLLLSNVLSLVKIDKLVVPELVEVTSPDVILDCQFTVPDENFTLQWMLNNSSIYVWTPLHKPNINGVLKGRLDPMYKVSNKSKEERRALRIINLTPELNGNYTCIVRCHGVTTQQTKPMIIYSYEREFDLITKFNYNGDILASCIARGVYPQPDLIIEFNNQMVSGQWQRVWRGDHVGGGWLYDATCQAQIKPRSVNDKAVILCRLNLPEADYTAIKKKVIFLDGMNQGSCVSMRYINYDLLFTTLCVLYYY